MIDENYEEQVQTITGKRIHRKHLFFKFHSIKAACRRDMIYCHRVSLHGPHFFSVSKRKNAIFYYQNGNWIRHESVQNIRFLLRDGTTLRIPLPDDIEDTTSDEEDLAQEETNGTSNVSHQTGSEAVDRRHSDESDSSLIRRALVPYIFYKIFSGNMPFSTA